MTNLIKELGCYATSKTYPGVGHEWDYPEMHSDLLSFFNAHRLGDINHDSFLNLIDCIIVLQIMNGTQPNNFILSADIDSNGKIGMEEVIHIMQKISGLR